MAGWLGPADSYMESPASTVRSSSTGPPRDREPAFDPRLRLGAALDLLMRARLVRFFAVVRDVWFFFVFVAVLFFVAMMASCLDSAPVILGAIAIPNQTLPSVIP